MLITCNQVVLFLIYLITTNIDSVSRGTSTFEWNIVYIYNLILCRCYINHNIVDYKYKNYIYIPGTLTATMHDIMKYDFNVMMIRLRITYKFELLNYFFHLKFLRCKPAMVCEIQVRKQPTWMITCIYMTVNVIM